MGASLNMIVNLSNNTPWVIRIHIGSESRRRFNYKDENNGLSPITGHCPFNSLSQQILPSVFISLLLFLGFSFMSSRSSSADHRIVEVDGDFLPYPATKLVITQYLEASSDPPFWALIVVGAFFDQHDNTIWSTELFVAHLDIQLESDDSSEGESEWESSSEDSTSEFEAPTTAIAEPARYSAPRIDSQSRPSAVPFHPPQNWAFPPNPQNLALTGSWGYWNPTSYGPAPGHWLASFDHTLGRWVHTWQAE